MKSTSLPNWWAIRLAGLAAIIFGVMYLFGTTHIDLYNPFKLPFSVVIFTLRIETFGIIAILAIYTLTQIFVRCLAYLDDGKNYSTIAVVFKFVGGSVSAVVGGIVGMTVGGSVSAVGGVVVSAVVGGIVGVVGGVVVSGFIFNRLAKMKLPRLKRLGTLLSTFFRFLLVPPKQ